MDDLGSDTKETIIDVLKTVGEIVNNNVYPESYDNDTKEIIIYALKTIAKLVNTNVYPEWFDPAYGICFNTSKYIGLENKTNPDIFYSFDWNLVEELHDKEWFTCYSAYPINREKYTNNIENVWDLTTEYGQHRLELIEILIRYFSQ